MHMQTLRYPLYLVAIGTILFLAFATAAQAQQAAGDIGALPISFILDNTMDDHAQEIKQNIYEYQFREAAGDPAAQSGLVQKRSEDLKRDATGKKKTISAILSYNGSISYEQLEAMAAEISSGVDRLNGWSRRLEEHAAGLSLLNGHKAYADPIVPLLGDIDDIRGLAGKVAQAAKDKKNESSKNAEKAH